MRPLDVGLGLAALLQQTKNSPLAHFQYFLFQFQINFLQNVYFYCKFFPSLSSSLPPPPIDISFPLSSSK